jgi:hypothetical protein
MQSLEDFPSWLATFWDISLESAEIIISIVVISAILLPVLYLTRGKSNMIAVLTFFLSEALLVGLGWLDSWVMIATVCVLALFVAKFGADMVTGGD